MSSRSIPPEPLPKNLDRGFRWILACHIFLKEVWYDQQYETTA